MIAVTLLGVTMLGITGCSGNSNNSKNNVTQQNEVEQQEQEAKVEEDPIVALSQYIDQANSVYKNISFNYSMQATEYNADKWESYKQQAIKDIDALKVPDVNMTEAQRKLPENLRGYLDKVDALLKETIDFEPAIEAEELVRVPLGYRPREKQEEVKTDTTSTPATNEAQTTENSNRLDKATYLAQCQKLYKEVKDMYKRQKDNFVPSEWASFMRSINEKSDNLGNNQPTDGLSIDQSTLAGDIRQLASDYGKVLQGRDVWDRINDYTKRIENAINGVNQE